MSISRFEAIRETINRETKKVDIPSERISEYFGENVFTPAVMKRYVGKDTLRNFQDAIKNNKKIGLTTADHIASAMKAWAMEKGAKSYTHWFQPLTGSTAEKHDTFFIPNGADDAIEAFSGESLIQQEPDASSFPNGGIRETFEARGYTAWDPTSPAFIMEIGDGTTLCIPTIFISYNGDSLDYKAPLLKSSQFIEDAALPVVNLFDSKASKVTPTLGWEQEYFLVDEAMYFARPDLYLTGRAIFGHEPAKGQQLDDHYFGTIPERIYAFMLDLEKESHKLGIPVRTRHNEVAPNQFECAPMFEEVNVAVDHNQLLMDLMERVAKRHRLRVLLHEKPFSGINGSGKHNNWSLGTNTGKNLLSPGKTPKNNLQFLTFFVNVIKAVNEYGDLIRASIASASNDHRLGANEAPPAIISVFIGSHLSAVLDEIEKRVLKGKFDELSNADLKLNIHNKIPDLFQDNTDRNRTSPFAFTGNKFEIRAVGSTANCAWPMIVMNTIVGNQLKAFKADYDELKAEGETKDGAILRILRRYIGDSRKVLFEGDNYSSDWEVEAEKRGLKNIKTTPYALDLLLDKKNEKVFTENNIFNEREYHARYEILNEMYNMNIQIESRIIGDMAGTHVIPAAIEYQNDLIQNVTGLKNLGLDSDSVQGQMEILIKVSKRINEIKRNIDLMIKERKEANRLDSAADRAKAYCDKVKPIFDEIKYHSDKLEIMINDKYWPLPKYREMLLIK